MDVVAAGADLRAGLLVSGRHDDDAGDADAGDDGVDGKHDDGDPHMDTADCWDAAVDQGDCDVVCEDPVARRLVPRLPWPREKRGPCLAPSVRGLDTSPSFRNLKCRVIWMPILKT